MSELINNACKFYLTDSYTDECCCAKAYHASYKFGEGAKKGRKPIYIDNSPDEDIEVSPDEQDHYNEKYNKYTGESCLCCNTQLLELNTHHCSECGCFLCASCTIRGKFGMDSYYIEYEGVEEYCYNCRRFGFEKNCLFWNTFYDTKYIFFSIEEYETVCGSYYLYDDWYNAACYY